MFTTVTTGEGHALVRRYGTLIGRILMGILFVLAGVGKFNTLAGTVSYIASVGLPMPEVLTYLTILVEVGCGLMLIVGWRIGNAAALLISFTALASWFFHNPSTWTLPAPTGTVQQIMFMKNLALIGGLLYMMAYGPGDGWSLTKKDTSDTAVI